MALRRDPNADDLRRRDEVLGSNWLIGMNAMICGCAALPRWVGGKSGFLQAVGAWESSTCDFCEFLYNCPAWQPANDPL
jgi:hypothetical protein